MSDYQEFLKSKRDHVQSVGVYVSDIHPLLFPFQADVTRWACRKGRAAIFLDTGLGKTYCSLEWARQIGGKCLILAPLTVAKQTMKMAGDIGLSIKFVRNPSELTEGISITNYDLIDRFLGAKPDSIVLDESSILKSLNSKTRQKLIESFADVPYKLCCTATPAPNDISEIANHAEFLGVMKRTDMLSSFFVHDEDEWRLKGHAEEPFYRWMTSWSLSMRMPSDLGYEDDGFVLSELQTSPHFVDAVVPSKGKLFFTGLSGIGDRIHIRKHTVAARIEKAIELCAGNDQWILWCGLNDEADSLARRISDSVNVEGAMTSDEKIQSIEDFQHGKTRVLVTKCKIAGFGMNLQNCHKMAFVGMNDSWEAYYQAVRRCHRFGQKHPVEVHCIVSDAESQVFDNVMAKQVQADKMRERLIRDVAAYEVEELTSSAEVVMASSNRTVETKYATMMSGDCIERLKDVGESSVDLSVFSPPFAQLYVYSPSERDIGNCRSMDEFFEHFGFVSDELLRVTKPGRECCVHVSQIPAMQVRDGYIGVKDFRGMTISMFEAHGWIYHGEVCIDKDPQAQAIRTHSKALLFVSIRRDASWLRPALADYILVFRKPGENQVPIIPDDISNNDWIEWARPIWYGIKETNTLNYRVARDDKDERHICPLQLGVIERCVRLWSNPGELILDPFMGIGSTGYVAVEQGRKFSGIELKDSWFNWAVKNVKFAEEKAHSKNLFSIGERDHGYVTERGSGEAYQAGEGTESGDRAKLAGARENLSPDD